MSRLNELIEFANYIGSERKEERRYQDQRNLQLAQLGEKKLNEQKLVKSQQFLNDAVKQFSQTGWQEGVYNPSTVNKEDVIEEYLGKMRGMGMAGDRFTLDNKLKEVEAYNLQNDTAVFRKKLSSWDAANADRKDDWKIFGGSYDKDRKNFIKSIGGQNLFYDLQGVGGDMKATELTGLTPGTFDKKDTGMMKTVKDNPIKSIIGAGATLALGKWGGPKAYKSLKGVFSKVAKETPITPKEVEQVKLLMPNIQDPSARKIMQKIMDAQNSGNVPLARKLLERFNTKFPQLGVLDDIVNPKVLDDIIKEGAKKGAAAKDAPGIIAQAKNLIKGRPANFKKALLNSGYAKFSLGAMGGSAAASKIAEWVGAGEGTQAIAEVGGGIGGALSAPKVIKAMTNPAVMQAVSRHAPKIAAKLAISSAGYIGPQAAEPISTALGVAGTAWAAYDIMRLAKEVPEIYDAIVNS